MHEKMIKRVLRVDSSARHNESVSRDLGDEIVRRLAQQHPGMQVDQIDLGAGMTHIDAAWVAANFTPADQRDDAAKARLEASDEAVAALTRSDAVVLTAPVYNFSVPSTLKAWIDHVCRAGLTFRYTDNGPQGLLHDRPVYLAMASGGVPFGSAADFASTYLQQVFGFVGIQDVRLVGAERVAVDPDTAFARALRHLDKWLPDTNDEAA